MDSPKKCQWRGALTFSWFAQEQMVEQTIESPVMWDVIALMITPLYCYFILQYLVALCRKLKYQTHGLNIDSFRFRFQYIVYLSNNFGRYKIKILSIVYLQIIKSNYKSTFTSNSWNWRNTKVVCAHIKGRFWCCHMVNAPFKCHPRLKPCIAPYFNTLENFKIYPPSLALNVKWW